VGVFGKTWKVGGKPPQEHEYAVEPKKCAHASTRSNFEIDIAMFNCDLAINFVKPQRDQENEEQER
jgi:hypothetical protein